MIKEFVEKMLLIINKLSLENSKPRANSWLNAELIRKLKETVLSLDNAELTKKENIKEEDVKGRIEQSVDDLEDEEEDDNILILD